MNNNQLAAWTDALRYLTTADDAPATARDDCHQALLALDASNELRHREHLTAHQALQKLRTREHSNIPQVVDQLRNGVPTDIDSSVQLLEQLHQSLGTAQRRALMVDTAHKSITNQICGGVLLPHHEPLLHWIAQRRNAQPFDCGRPTPTLTEQIGLIYSLVNPLWSPNWEPRLNLERARHLPLFYSAHWSRHRRASLAWAWEQLALGRVRWINDPDGFTSVLEPINKVGALPKAPELPTVVTQ